MSWLFLDARYSPGHWLGSGACVGGLALLILTDRAFSSPTDTSRPLVGDLLVLVGASGYAACNVMQEKLLGTSPLFPALYCVQLMPHRTLL